MTCHPYRKELEALRSSDHASFSGKLSPDIDPDAFLGIKSPVLKDFAKEMRDASEREAFLSDLPHKYHEENMLHSYVITRTRPFEACLEELSRFLPYINDWAVCDVIRPAVFKKNTAALEPYLEEWLTSQEPFIVRSAIGFYMSYFLEDAFRFDQMEKIAAVRFDHYYVRMMIAWYFATALAKQRDAAMRILKEERLEEWTHNKAIQKAIESYRISDADKELLRSMKRRSQR